jgi:DNA-binding transcriptional MocR family regulator
VRAVGVWIDVDSRGGVPIYVQIVDQVRHAIEVGGLRAGERLPTVRRLAEDLEAELAEERRRREVADRERKEALREWDELRRRLDAPKSPEAPREVGASTHRARFPSYVAPEAPETPAQGFGTDAAGEEPQRQAAPRRWRRWRRS